MYNMQPIYSTSDGKIEFQQLPATDVLIIETPYLVELSGISKIKQEITNPYIIFINNPNLKELKTHYIKTK